MSATQEWTSVKDLIRILEKRWDRGIYLRGYLDGEPWKPISIPIRGPRAVDVARRSGDVAAWRKQFERDNIANRTELFTLVYRTARNKTVGHTSVAVRANVNSFQQLCAILLKTDDVRALDDMREKAGATVPVLDAWVVKYPLRALEVRDLWPELLTAVSLITRDNSPNDVDAEFINEHRRILSDLLEAALPAERIDRTRRRSDLAARYGFGAKPVHVRIRFLDRRAAAAAHMPAGVSDVAFRSDELAQLKMPSPVVFVVESEATFLKLPDVPGSIAILAEKLDVAKLRNIDWLQDKRLVYWGDIDTHGFATLDQLRAYFPQTESLLMDARTLTMHKEQWVRESRAASRNLRHLTSAEAKLYGDLVGGKYGAAVRLEQGRLRASHVAAAITKISALSAR